jgi:hypothetical protein
MARAHLLTLFSLSLLCVTAIAQPGAKSTQPNEVKTIPAKSVSKAKPAADPEAERILKERRAQAQALLISLAADAGSYNDQKLRARTQARIADVLWETDQERARTLFRKAWDAAEIVDQDGRRRMQEEMRQKEARGGSVAVTGPPNVRGEVLRMAARRDRALGEELLAKLKVEKAQEAAEATDKARRDPFDSPEGLSQRLSLARQLLATDVERALQFADPALVTLSREAIDFLSYLREKDAAAADRRYAGMVAMAGGSLQSDANTVSLLSSFLFTPHIFVAFTADGASTTQTARGSEPPQVAPELRTAFFRTAFAILQRPLAPPGQDQTSAGIQGKYLMIKRLLPLFEQFSTREMTEAMRAQAEALGSTLPENARERDDDTMREGIRPPQAGEDREKALLDRIDRAKTSAERDGLYLQLALIRSESSDLRARDFVDKIEETELRKSVRAFIDATMTLRAVDKKETDKILELVRTGELTRLQKVWALSQAAKLLEMTDHEKSLAVIEEAATEARRIEGSDADRPRALMAVANAWLVTDRSKSWDAVYDAVKAGNSAEGFTGEDGLLRISLETQTIGTVRTSTVQDFDVSGLFTELAKEDYNRTVELARGFDREAPRASAVIAIARAVLENKDKTGAN